MVSAALSLSLRNICLDTMTLQSDRDFNIADFNRRATSTIVLESLLVAPFVPTFKIKNSGFS